MDERHRKKIRLLVAFVSLIFVVFGALFLYVVSIVIGEFRDKYAEIRISPKQSVWLHFKGDRLQMASSAEGLKQARWIEANEDEVEYTSLPAVTLPVTKASSGFEKVQADFDLFLGDCSVTWTLMQKDVAGVEWEYQVEDTLEVATSPKRVKPNNLPRLTTPSLDIELKPDYEDGKPVIGIGLECSSSKKNTDEEMDVSDILKDGKSVDVQIQIFDSSGKQVVSVKEPLSELGFTWSDSGYSVRVAKPGNYSCKVTMDTGPIGSLVKASASVTTNDWPAKKTK